MSFYVHPGVLGMVEGFLAVKAVSDVLRRLIISSRLSFCLLGIRNAELLSRIK